MRETAGVRRHAGSYSSVVLDGAFNNVALTSGERLADGAFNVWGNSLPAATVPSGAVDLHGIPFRLRGSGAHDNVRCAGQVLRLEPARAEWLHVVAASERRTEDVVALHYTDGSCDLEALRVSDFWPAEPRFGEVAAFRSAHMHYPHHVQHGLAGQIWLTRVPVVRRTPLAMVRLPDNPAIHIFAVTVELSR